MPRPEEVRFSAGQLTLAGELVLPDTAVDRVPWVLLLASFGPRDRDGAFDRQQHPGWFADATPGDPGLLRRLAAALAEVGVASFRYDARGCGASDGEWAGSDLFARIDDARDAIAAMRGRTQLDLRRCGIAAHGEGALLALSVAIGDPVLSALTLVGAPARSARDVLRRGAAERERTGTDRQHPFVAALDRHAEELIERAARHEPGMELPLLDGAARIGLAAWRQAFDTPGMALATMLHRSVTLVHGAGDAWVDPDESDLLATALRDAGNEPGLTVVPGAGHDLAEADDGTIGQVARDLAVRLVPRELPPVLISLEARPADSG
ncbi:MAG TPA: alpha/beta fold hydrolase [Candidatus Limnocylindria bacterium]|nr:alpha/beta fold hydrolase [Candidatus Limnocylindria bacterium]